MFSNSGSARKHIKLRTVHQHEKFPAFFPKEQGEDMHYAHTDVF